MVTVTVRGNDPNFRFFSEGSQKEHVVLSTDDGHRIRVLPLGIQSRIPNATCPQSLVDYC